MLNDKKLINPEVRIENTNMCNALCVTCPREKMTRPLTTMCYGFFTNLVDQAKALGAKMISVFGYGEPLMDKSIAEKIGYCSDNHLETFITTNASLLDLDTIYRLLDAGLKNIRFSLHAITPIQYAKVHQRLDWLAVFRNFGNFVSINKGRGSPCVVHITMMPMANESVFDIRQVWESKCDYLEIWRPHNWCRGRTYRQVDVKKRTCGRPFSGPVQIQADGTVIPCCFLTNSELILGDTNDDTILNILKGVEYQGFRNKHRFGNLLGLPCLACDQLNVENHSPLLYSNRDPDMEINKTSTAKITVSK